MRVRLSPGKISILLYGSLSDRAPFPFLIEIEFYHELSLTNLILCALIEFSTATFACLAKNYLDRTGLRGNALIATVSSERPDNVTPHRVFMDP